MEVEKKMHFVGVLREFQPNIEEIPPGPRTPETNRLLKRGQLWWAGEEFLRPGLYVWTGEAHVLVESRSNIIVKMEAAVKDSSGPVTKDEWESPKPHKGEEEEE